MDRTTPEWGFDEEFVGYDFRRPVPLDDLTLAKNLLEQVMEPPSPNEVFTLLAMLKAGTKAKEEHVQELTLRLQLLEDLCSEYPRDVVVAGVTGWVDKEMWFPSRGEMRQRFERLMPRRRALNDIFGMARTV